MFFGEYRHVLDSKNRLRLPPKLKKEFSGSIILTKGSDGCIFVLPKEKFDSVFSSVSSLALFDSKAQRPIRLLFSSAVELQEDSQGRFLLPASLKSYAGIEKNVVFVGAGNRVELWNQEKWDNYSQSTNFDTIAKELGSYGV